MRRWRENKAISLRPVLASGLKMVIIAPSKLHPIRLSISFVAFTLEGWKKPSQITPTALLAPPSASWRPLSSCAAEKS
jgi:hypothetical protein